MRVRRSIGGLAAAGMLLAAVPASAGAPTVATDGAEATGTTTARVIGNADPNGQKTSLRALYALASSRWCMTGGERGMTSKTKAIKLGKGNVMISEIIVPLEGLKPNQRYCTELVAMNMSGRAHGGQVTFMTPSE